MRPPDERTFFEVLVELRALPPLRAMAVRKRLKESGRPLTMADLAALRVEPVVIAQALERVGCPPLLLRAVDHSVLQAVAAEEWEQLACVPLMQEEPSVGAGGFRIPRGLWIAAAEPFEPGVWALAGRLGAVGVGYAEREGLLEVLRRELARVQQALPTGDRPLGVAASAGPEGDRPPGASRERRVLQALGLGHLEPPPSARHEVEHWLVEEGHIGEGALYAELSRASGCPLWPGLDGLLLERQPEQAEILERLRLLSVRKEGQAYYVTWRAFVEDEIAAAGLERRPVALTYPEIWRMAHRSAQRGRPAGARPRSALEALWLKGRIDRRTFEEHQADPRRGESLLLAQGLVSEEQLTEARAEALGLAYVDLQTAPPDPAVRRRISDAYAISLRAIPYRINDAGELVVAVSDPEDIQRNDELRMLLRNTPLRLALASPSAIQRVIARDYGQQRDLEEVSALAEGEGEGGGGAEGLEVEGNALDRLVGSFIREALLSDASDIHIESHKHQGVVRMRRDGELHEYTTLPARSTPLVIQKVKLKANLDIAERRRPQDGRFRFKEGGLEASVRVSTVPGLYGEKAVLRLLRNEGKAPPLEEAGFQADTLEALRRIIRRPYGLFLITGPTGSGKTRTGISILSEIARPEVNVLTVEDPVEYELPGLTQVQVNPQAGVSFADVLRAFLRQDPDIIYVGEIRDRETAQVAVQAAFTGHLVIATLHTNDAPSSATRLMDLGVDPANVSAALLGVLAQRLVRRLCPACSSEDREGKSERLLHRELRHARLPNPDGCRHCRGGYAGRTGIFELMEVDRTLQSALAQRAPTERIRELALEKGMRTLAEDGVLKVEQGVTSAEEVLAKTMA
ncbi:GspE/PulE family protein [Calidithermus chliarophilus]|uniref:GspE/PulE family protein n=1 Tax=Calidithermus chliarophilus TaxID=52023 RepID=UPI000428A5C0|nr:GspE/PulE family protein [Calidithermus chliarophilus]